MKPNSAVTIRDVAREAGCSTAAVCIAFTGNGRISEETRRRILDKAAELGYTPNRSAQMLSRSSIHICVILPRSPIEVQSLLLRGIEKGFRSDIRPDHCSYRLYDSTEESILAALSDIPEETDGIILEMTDYQKPAVIQALEALNDRRLPVVKVVGGPGIVREVCTVSVFAEEVGAVAAQLLALRGCHSCAIFCGEEDSDIHNRNIRGFIGNMERLGMQFHSVHHTRDDPALASLKVHSLLKSTNPPDGIFVSSYLAFAVAQAAEDYTDRSLAIVGVDLHDQNRRALAEGRLAAVIAQNQEEQGERAVRLLLRAILHQSMADLSERIVPEIVLSSNLSCYSSPESSEQLPRQ